MSSTESPTPEAESQEEQPKQKLNLDVQIEKRGACQRHVVVNISREDVDRYFADAVQEMAPNVAVPGFRPGKAPLKLVEGRFRKEVETQVKGSLLMDSLQQISEDSHLAPISEPDLDIDTVAVARDGPMTFEFDLEVRPEFDLPQWKGLELEKLVRDFTDEDVDRRLKEKLSRFGRMASHEGPVGADDYVTLNMTFTHDGEEVSSHEDVDVRVKPVLSFHDAKLEGFDELVTGAKPGDKRQAKIKLSEECAEESLRGQEVDAEFEVIEIQKLELPALTEKVLAQVGEFESEGELREAVLRELETQLAYHQQRHIRNQITNALTESADWELPPELVKRQIPRERDRMIMELRSRGFTEEYIRAHQNELRQSIMATTRRALREHFILEKLAEEEKIEAAPEDIDMEIQLIARQSNEPVRRTRARIEKRGLMDAVHNQVVERKAVQLIESHARFKEVPFDPATEHVEAVDVAIAGELEEEIPEARHGEQETLPAMADHK